jgi:hypothetical protein
VSGQLHAPAALPPGKSPRDLFYRRLGGPQIRFGRYEEVKIFTLPGLELPPPTWSSNPLPVATTTELSRLIPWCGAVGIYYFTKLSVSKLNSSRLQDDQRVKCAGFYGNSCGIVELLRWYLPGGTEENHKNPQS